MDFSKNMVVELTLENSKPDKAEEILDEVFNDIINSAKLGLWSVKKVVGEEVQQEMLWVSAKLQRMGFSVEMSTPRTFLISWQ